MKIIYATLSLLALTARNDTIAAAQQSAPKTKTAARDKPLVLTEAIPLEDAKGRFDHFATGGGRLFVAALGSNAVEAINIGGRVLEHTITVSVS